VLTEPRVFDCWSVNLSESGIGLIATARPGDSDPGEGDHLDLEFRLPDSGTVVRVGGVVAWCHTAPSDDQDGVSLSMGVRIHEASDAHRIALAHYLRDYRFHVAVGFASEAQRAVLQQSLASQTDLHFASDVKELSAICRRGDISVLLLFATDASFFLPTIEWIRSWSDPGGRPQDLAPRVICTAGAAADALVALAERRSLFRVLPLPLDPETLAEGVLKGCRDYGVRTEERRVAFALERALTRERARNRAPARLHGWVAAHVVSESPTMRKLLEQVKAVASHRISVLLQGETGTGKEVLARTIHELSERANSVFVVQDCGTLTETLLESELFGHVRGAFTGADNDRSGLFVLADGGTIFLDEITNTSPEVQAKLLRVIETGEIRPVGSTKVRVVDVRVIAASNRDVRADVEAGRMRRDLFYRLNSFPIDVPPLRERRSDILPLARHFLREACHALGRIPTPLGAETADALLSHDWPGNAREIRNVVERALVLTPPEAACIHVNALPEELVQRAGRVRHRRAARGGTLKSQVEQFEAELIREALKANGGVLQRAAVELHVDASTLSRKAKRYGLT
jgi:DNA-binding NtrC family response regulator